MKSNRQYLKNQQTVLNPPYLPCKTVLRLPKIHARQFWISLAFYSPLVCPTPTWRKKGCPINPCPISLNRSNLFIERGLQTSYKASLLSRNRSAFGFLDVRISQTDVIRRLLSFSCPSHMHCAAGLISDQMSTLSGQDLSKRQKEFWNNQICTKPIKHSPKVLQICKYFKYCQRHSKNITKDISDPRFKFFCLS